MRKSVKAIGIICIILLMLTGCSLEEESVSINGLYDVRVDDTNKADRLKDIEDNHIFVITDDKTGVQYIIYSEFNYRKGAGGITPRYNADGTLYIDPEWVAEQGEE